MSTVIEREKKSDSLFRLNGGLEHEINDLNAPTFPRSAYTEQSTANEESNCLRYKR